VHGTVTGRASLLKSLSKVLSDVRESSLSVVEGIVGWRSQTGQTPSTPYLVDGTPYIDHIKSDLSFLDDIPELHAWLGFSAAGNPFLLNRARRGPLLPQGASKGIVPEEAPVPGIATPRGEIPMAGERPYQPLIRPELQLRVTNAMKALRKELGVKNGPLKKREKQRRNTTPANVVVPYEDLLSPEPLASPGPRIKGQDFSNYRLLPGIIVKGDEPLEDEDPEESEDSRPVSVLSSSHRGLRDTNEVELYQGVRAEWVRGQEEAKRKNEARKNSASLLGAGVRGYVARKAARKAHAAGLLQRGWRGAMARKRVRELRRISARLAEIKKKKARALAAIQGEEASRILAAAKKRRMEMETEMLREKVASEEARRDGAARTLQESWHLRQDMKALQKEQLSLKSLRRKRKAEEAEAAMAEAYRIRKLEESSETKEKGAMKLTAGVRGCISRRVTRVASREEDAEARRKVRGYCVGGIERRAVTARKRDAAATAIEAAWRGYNTRECNPLMMMSTMEKAMSKAGAAERVQGGIRGWIERVRVKGRAVRHRRESAGRIQAHMSGYMGRKEVKKLSSEAIYLKGIQQKKTLLSRETVSRERVQLNIKEVSSLSPSAVMIQAAWRGKLTRMKQGSYYQQVWVEFQSRLTPTKELESCSIPMDGSRMVGDCIRIAPTPIKKGVNTDLGDSVMDEYAMLVRFLKAIGLEELLPRFQKEAITFSDLQLITLDELEECGFSLIRERLGDASGIVDL